MNEKSKFSGPLCVDLDGSLIKHDSVAIAFYLLMKRNVFQACYALLHLFKGKASYKTYLAKHISLDPKTLSYNKVLIEWLKQQQQAGRTIVLATASDEKFAKPIADYIGLFSECIASNAKTHLKGKHKRDELNRRYGKKGYDYVGNHSADYPIWNDAREAIIVNASSNVIETAKKTSNVTKIFPK